MQVILNNIGKRFGNDWIVRGMNDTFSSGERIAILGPNGSGKSTLLKLIASFHVATEGEITYNNEGNVIPVENIFRYISYASPYLELIEQMTVRELIIHHQKFKPFMKGIGHYDVVELLKMENHANKPVQLLSSGMKMKLRLALAVLSDTQLLLLDEPLSNIDRQGREWYRSLVAEYLNDRLVFVCSNHIEEEHFFCNRMVELQMASKPDH